MTAVITGVGKALPEKRLTNADLEKMVETSDEWISKRVGIKERRMAEDGEWTSHLAARAARDALAMSGIPAEQIDLILVSTTTPDTLYPSVSCLVQRAIGAVNAGAMDVAAACTGFIYAMGTAWSMIRSGLMKNVIVIAAEVVTSSLDWTDRDTCVLFGDGAGAVVLSASEQEGTGILAMRLRADGTYADILKLPNSGSRVFPEYAGRFVKMQGNDVFRHAVRDMVECATDVVAAAGLTLADVDLFIPHQANIRIIDAIATRLNVPPEKMFVNIENYGNTSSATLPIALCEAVEQGRLKPGDILVLDAFGAGLTWGAMAIRWK
ncbi:MAG: ketoacyl-ACP synthase III [Kiritimatiellaeota bacterium]|nr:ketoacyl-ACP synthase III [Kiritimatiellota bacterium]